MMPTPDLKILFFINPVSGGKNKINWEPIIRDYFKPLSIAIELFVLTGKNDATLIQNKIKILSPEKVVAVGGDGTVSLIAKQLLGTSIQLGILRGGSANGMAEELKIPADPKRAIDMILKGKVKKCDVIRINENDICIHLSDFGLNARLVKYFDKSAFRGMWGYARMVLKILWQRKLLYAHIEGEDININTPAFMIVIANASKYGTGAMINPEGLISDGKFELVIVREISLAEIFKMFLNKKRFNSKKVEIFHATKAVITTGKNAHFQIDGEYKGKINKVVAEILPSALSLLVENNEISSGEIKQ